jgi:hypothetical protein
MNMVNAFIWNSFVAKWSSSTCLCSSLACMPINAFLSKQYPYVFPQSPVAIHISSEPAPSDYSTTLLARAFKSEEVINLPRVSLEETEIIILRGCFRGRLLCPSMKMKHVMNSFVFRRLSLQIKKKFFYVVCADEGPEA